MPKIKAFLALEFEADGSDQASIDLALDQALILQPSCQLVSKMIAAVDGRAVNGDSVSKASAMLEPAHATTGQGSGLRGDSYGPGYASPGGGNERTDSYRIATPSGPSVPAIDCYQPTHQALSTAAAVYPGGQATLPSSGPAGYQTSNTPLSPTGYTAGLSLPGPVQSPTSDRAQPSMTHKPYSPDWPPQYLSGMGNSHLPPAGYYPALYLPGINNLPHVNANLPTVGYNPETGCPTQAIDDNRGQDPEHYSPAPASRRDRSASPASGGLRRSDRLRNAASNRRGSDACTPGRRSKNSRSDARRKSSSSSKDRRESRLETLSRRRDQDSKQLDDAEPDSLEALASKTTTKELASERNKFERQQQRHGMTEALRLKELRTKQKSEKARRIFNKQRWDQGQDQDGPRMDAVIDEIACFDFGSSSSTAPAAAAASDNDNANDNGRSETEPEPEPSHPPVETRKKKRPGPGPGKGRGREGRDAGAGSGTGTWTWIGSSSPGDEMQDVECQGGGGGGRGRGESSSPSSSSSAAAAAAAAARPAGAPAF